MDRRGVFVALVVVLAGCAVPFDAGTDGSGSGSLDPGSSGSGSLGPGTETAAPWSETELVVTLSGDAPGGLEYAPLVRETLGYWEDNAEAYLGHPVRFRFEPNASDPDIVVRLVDEIAECGTEDHAAGCSPFLEDLRRHDDTVDIRIKRGFGRESTLLVMQHEFGHALGLRHDDAPTDVMRNQATLATQPQRNATERPVPWDDPTLTVFVDDSNVSAADRPAVRRQVQHALDYYDDGAAGTIPANVSFRVTDNRIAADVTVTFPETIPCGPAGGDPQSCALLRGTDPDRDGARETYTRVDIYLSTMDTDAVGWHVGRWLGTAIGLSRSELAPPFVDASFRDRRSEWWQ
jgi:hypothetical protein